MSDEKGVYRVTARAHANETPGGWYYGFTCKSCGKRYAVFYDKHKGAQPPERITGGGKFFCDCPYCESGHYYEVTELENFQAT